MLLLMNAIIYSTRYSANKACEQGCSQALLYNDRVRFNINRNFSRRPSGGFFVLFSRSACWIIDLKSIIAVGWNIIQDSAQIVSENVNKV